MEDVATLTPCWSPTLFFVLFALRVPSSSVNAFLKIDVVLAKARLVRRASRARGEERKLALRARLLLRGLNLTYQ